LIVDFAQFSGQTLWTPDFARPERHLPLDEILALSVKDGLLPF
jgi:hypothetical protein